MKTKTIMPGATYSRLQISWFDRITSLLMAIMLLMGCCVFVLLIVWMLPGRKPIVLSQPPTYSSSGAGMAWSPDTPKFETPTATEVPTLVQPSIQQALLRISDAAREANITMDRSSMEIGIGAQSTGDSARQPGPESSADVVPRYERWELRFQASSQQEYARQLDFFDIELGVIGGGIDGVDLVRGFTSDPEVRRVDPGSLQRLYFVWLRESPLAAYDRRLVQAAQVLTEGRHMLKFIPEALEYELARAELEYARETGRSSEEEIAKTVFACRPATDGFSMDIMSQRYRTPR